MMKFAASSQQPAVPAVQLSVTVEPLTCGAFSRGGSIVSVAAPAAAPDARCAWKAGQSPLDALKTLQSTVDAAWTVKDGGGADTAAAVGAAGIGALPPHADASALTPATSSAANPARAPFRMFCRRVLYHQVYGTTSITSFDTAPVPQLFRPRMRTK